MSHRFDQNYYIASVAYNASVAQCIASIALSTQQQCYAATTLKVIKHGLMWSSQLFFYVHNDWTVISYEEVFFAVCFCTASPFRSIHHFILFVVKYIAWQPIVGILVKINWTILMITVVCSEKIKQNIDDYDELWVLIADSCVSR